MLKKCGLYAHKSIFTVIRIKQESRTQAWAHLIFIIEDSMYS